MLLIKHSKSCFAEASGMGEHSPFQGICSAEASGIGEREMFSGICSAEVSARETEKGPSKDPMGATGSYPVGNACTTASCTATTPGVTGSTVAASTSPTGGWAVSSPASAGLDPTSASTFTCSKYPNNDDWLSCTCTGPPTGGTCYTPVAGTATATTPAYCQGSATTGQLGFCTFTVPPKKTNWLLWGGVIAGLILLIVVVIVVIVVTRNKKKTVTKKDKGDGTVEVTEKEE